MREYYYIGGINEKRIREVGFVKPAHPIRVGRRGFVDNERGSGRSATSCLHHLPANNITAQHSTAMGMYQLYSVHFVQERNEEEEEVCIPCIEYVTLYV